jgi:hypothetical protein
MALVAKEKENEVKQENGEPDSAIVKTEEISEKSANTPSLVKVEDAPMGEENAEEARDSANKDEPSALAPPSRHALELGTILLEKQAMVVDVANLISQVSPLQEAVEAQLWSLNHVKRDTTYDKTVRPSHCSHQIQSQALRREAFELLHSIRALRSTGGHSSTSVSTG